MAETQPPSTGSADARATARIGIPVLPPLTALLEILVLMVLPAALDYGWPPFPSLAEFQPHFFWLPVLLLSLQYGTVSGLLAAGVAILLSAFLGWPDQEVGENHFSYLLRIWAQPVLWVAAALVLGQFRTRQIEQKQALARQLEELDSQRAAIADYAKNLRGRVELLERQLAGRIEPDSRRLLNGLSALAADASSSRSLFETAGLAFGACQIAVYSHETGALRLKYRLGSGLPGPLNDTFQPGTAIYELIVGDGRSLSVMTPGDEVLLAHDGLAAAPIRSESSGAVIGMLKLEHTPTSELDALTVARLDVFARLLSPTLEADAPTLHAVNGNGHHAQPAVAAKPRMWRQLKWRREATPRTKANVRSRWIG